MSMSPAGSESVPKLGSPEEEVSFGQEAAKAEAAGGDGAFKPYEEAAGSDGAFKLKEEAAGSDGAAKRPKPDEEDLEVANGAAKRPKPDEEEEEVANGAAKRPKSEAAALGDGPEPEEAALGDDDSEPELPPLSDDSDFVKEYREEMNLVHLYGRLLRGKKMQRSGQIKKVRVEGDAIERLLQVRPRDMPMPELPPLPKGFDLLPTDMRAACLRGRDEIMELHEYEQYIIDQYYEKGYAEVYSYVFDDE